MGRKQIETSTATVWLGADGITRAAFRAGARETLETARENVQAGVTISGAIERPLLLDMTHIGSMDKAARDYYAQGDQREGAEKAIALITNSALSRVIGNFFIGLNRPVKPTRLFTSEESALQWLRQYL